ncbi:MAG: type IV toxin-antitoxin system AbiEi family antitoxin domain-containing protein, partial [Nocardioides sp.]
MTNHQVHDALRDIALAQDGVVSRAQADRLGLSRSTIASRVTSGRWRAYGAHAVAIHPMPLSRRAQMHVSLWEAGT